MTEKFPIINTEESGEEGLEKTENQGESTLPNLENLLQEPTPDCANVIAKANRQQYEAGGGVIGDGDWWRTNHGRILEDLIPKSAGHKRVGKEITRLFQFAIGGEVLCDLGSAGGRMESIAEAFKASLYVDVDKYPKGQNDRTPIDPTKGESELREFRKMVMKKDGGWTWGDVTGVLPEIHVRADMLDFVSRLKDSSVNIVINGIDGSIIDVEEYHKLLARELLRVVKPNGIIFGNNTDSLSVLENMIALDPELQKQFELIDRENKHLGVGGVVIIHRKAI